MERRGREGGREEGREGGGELTCDIRPIMMYTREGPTRGMKQTAAESSSAASRILAVPSYVGDSQNEHT